MSLDRSTVVVTGASSGTGAAAARLLHRQGASVVVVGRDRNRTRSVAAELTVPWYTADFTVLDEVRGLAARLSQDLPRIDVLADNAGGAVRSTRPTVDGNEANYQVNALAPLLLTTLLTPLLERTHGRIVSTSSRSHRGAILSAASASAELDRGTGLSPHQRYARAKLAALLLHREHAHRHPQLTMVDFHPGIVATDFGRYLGPAGAVLKVLARPFLTSPDTAASHLVHLAVTPEHVNGRYFDKRQPQEPSPLVADNELAAAVWEDARRRLNHFVEPLPRSPTGSP